MGRWRVLVALAVLVAGVSVLSGAVTAEIAGVERGDTDDVGANQAIPTGDVKLANEPVFLDEAQETGITLVGTLSGAEVGVLEIVNEVTDVGETLEVEAGQWNRDVPPAVLEELQEGDIIRAALFQPESGELLGRARTRIAVQGEPPYGSVSVDTPLFAGQDGFNVEFNSPESEAVLRVRNDATGGQVSTVVDGDGTVSVEAGELGGIRVGEYVVAELLGPGGDPLLSEEVVRVTTDEAPSVALQDPIFDTDTEVSVTVSDLATIEGSGWLRVENQQTEQGEVVELSEDQEVEVTADQLGGLEPGDTILAELSASESGDVVLDRDTTTVTEQAATGSVDLEDQVLADEGLFNATITSLDNAGGSGWLGVENLNNSGPSLSTEVVAGDVVSFTADEVGGFQPGDTLEATLAADSDFVDVLDTDTTTVTEAAEPTGTVDLEDQVLADEGILNATITGLDNAGGSGFLRVENLDNADSFVSAEVVAGEVVSLTAGEVGGFQPGDTLEARLAADSDFVDVLDTDSTTVTEQAEPTGAVDIEDQILADEGLLNVTITALDNAGGSGFLRVENLDNTDPSVSSEVVAGDVVSVAATDIGGFQAGDTLEARLAADSDFVDVLDTDTTTVTEEAQPTGTVDLEDQILASEGLLNVTITALDSAGGSGFLRVENLDNADSFVSADVVAGDVVSVAATDIGGFQPGDTLEARIAADNDFVDILDTDSTTVTEQAEPTGAVDLEDQILADEGLFNATITSLDNAGGSGFLRVENLDNADSFVSAEVVAGEVVSLTATDIGGFQAGDTLEARLAADSDFVDILDTDTTTVSESDTGEPVIALASIDHPATIAADESLDVGYTLENTGDAAGTESSVTLLVGGTAVDTDSDVSVPAGGTVTGTVTFQNQDGYSGEETVAFTVELSTFDDAEGGTVDIEETPAQPAFVVDILETSAPVVAGGTLSVEANVTNTGAADEQQVELDIEGLGGDSTSLALDSGESTTETFTVATASGDAGEYTATVSSEDTQDSTGVTVLEASDTPEFVVDILGTGSPVLGGNELVVTVEITNTGGPDEQQVELGIDGLGGDSTSVSLDSGESTTETLTVGTTAGDVGEYTATVSSENSQDSTPVAVTETGEFVVSITGTNSPVTEGATLQVEAEIANTGGDDTQTLTLDAGALGTVETGVSLAGGETTQQSFTIETRPGDTGEYTATVSSEDTQDSTPVVVQDGEFVVSIVETNSPVDTGQQIEVLVEITNTGAEDTQTVSVDTELGGEEVSVSLGGGATTTETFTVQTTAGDSGEYTATAASEDTEDSAPVVVRGDNTGGSDPAAFNITITETNAPVEAGGTLQVEVNISNTGGTEATRTVTTEVGGLGSIETTVTLAADESTTESFTLETAPGDTGEYEATAATETDQDNALLAVTPSAGQQGNATFEVTVESVSTPPGGDGEFEANVTVANVGDAEGTETVTLSSNGTERGNETVTLAGGTAETLTFTWEQTLAVDNETTLEVTATAGGDTDVTEATLTPAQSGDGGGSGGISPTTGFGLLLLVALLLGLYYYVRRRQLRDQSGGGSDDDDGDGDTEGAGDGGGDDDSGTGGVTRVRSGGDSGDDNDSEAGDVTRVRSGGSSGDDDDSGAGDVAEVRSGGGPGGGDDN